jgi:hypothetical protein
VQAADGGAAPPPASVLPDLLGLPPRPKMPAQRPAFFVPAVPAVPENSDAQGLAENAYGYLQPEQPPAGVEDSTHQELATLPPPPPPPPQVPAPTWPHGQQDGGTAYAAPQTGGAPAQQWAEVDL